MWAPTATLSRTFIAKLQIILQGERCAVGSYASLLETGPWGDMAVLKLPGWDTPGRRRGSEGVPEHKPNLGGQDA